MAADMVTLDPLKRTSRVNETEAVMNGAWIILGLAVFGAIAAMNRWSHGRGRRPDLGFVSQQWVAEHRLSQSQSSQR